MTKGRILVVEDDFDISNMLRIYFTGQGFDVQVGDILETTPPWASSAVKCRVIEYIKDPDTELVELRLVEVE